MVPPPKPLNSFPVTDSAAWLVAAGGFAISVNPPNPKPPKKPVSCLGWEAADLPGDPGGGRGRPVFGSMFGDPALGPGDPGWEPGCDPGPNEPLGLRGTFGLSGPGDFRLGVIGGVPIFPESIMLFCFCSIGGLLESPLVIGGPPRCGEGGAEPWGVLMGGPGGSAPPRARCI